MAHLLAACRPNFPPGMKKNSKQTTPTMRTPMIQQGTIENVSFDRATYRPGESATIAIEIEGRVTEATPARVTAQISHLGKPLDEVEQNVTLRDGRQTVSLSFTPPPDAPRGYGLDLTLKSEGGQTLDHATTAFDVLNHWTEAPRYGFLSDFAPGRQDAEATLEMLSRYHLNGLQFYDWMYRHEQLLTAEEPYIDPLGRRLSLETVNDLIAAAHKRNIAAMPYTAVYAASIPFYEDHPDWALYQADGDPHYFGENFLVYMDPRPGSPWSEHLLAEFDRMLRETVFDGVHLDQYGAPKEAYDAQGVKFDLASPLAELINATRRVVDQRRDGGAVVFNAVTNWPVETVAPAGQDIVYIEVWDPYVWFEDLHTLIVEAQALGEGKPVVLAAYVDPAWEHNVRLMDAIIFASGGGHIELGERAAVLADPYFPNYRPMSPGLSTALRRYYGFAVRYQDVIGPRTRDATGNYLRRIEIDGASTSPAQRMNKVWPIVREGKAFTAINLVNLLGVDGVRWDEKVTAAPAGLEEVEVRIEQIEGEVAAVWMASPDGRNIAPMPLAFEIIGDPDREILTFTMPSLFYWNLIVIEWAS